MIFVRRTSNTETAPSPWRTGHGSAPKALWLLTLLLGLSALSPLGPSSLSHYPRK